MMLARMLPIVFPQMITWPYFKAGNRKPLQDSYKVVGSQNMYQKSVREHYKFQNPLLPDACWSRYFSVFERALHMQPRVGSPQPQEKVPKPVGVRHL